MSYKMFPDADAYISLQLLHVSLDVAKITVSFFKKAYISGCFYIM